MKYLQTEYRHQNVTHYDQLALSLKCRDVGVNECNKPVTDLKKTAHERHNRSRKASTNPAHFGDENPRKHRLERTKHNRSRIQEAGAAVTLKPRLSAFPRL